MGGEGFASHDVNMKPRFVGRLIAVLLCLVLLVRFAGPPLLRASLRAMFTDHHRACSNLGHAEKTSIPIAFESKSVAVSIQPTGNLATMSGPDVTVVAKTTVPEPTASSTTDSLGAMSPTTNATYTISNELIVPLNGRGLRIDATVYGQSGPLFPDGASLYVVESAQLDEVLTSRQLHTLIGSGVHGINEDIALKPGTYRLVSPEDVSKFGEVRARVCR